MSRRGASSWKLPEAGEAWESRTWCLALPAVLPFCCLFPGLCRQNFLPTLPLLPTAHGLLGAVARCFQAAEAARPEPVRAAAVRVCVRRLSVSIPSHMG